MESLTPRKRVLRTLEHRPPDRIPLDEPCGSFRRDTWSRLKAHYGCGEEAVKERLGIDVRTLGVNPSDAFRREAKIIEPLGLFKPLPGGCFEDEWGIAYEATSMGTHHRFVSHPLAEEESLETYEFPDLDAAGRWDGLEARARTWGERYLVVAAMWQTFFEMAWALRGFTAFLRDLYVNPGFAEKLLDRLFGYRREMGCRFIELNVDAAHLGDDVAMQHGLIVAPAVWRRFFKPRLKTLIDELKKRNANVYVQYHSDGDMARLIPELIEIGVQVLNPVQPECMDPALVKRLYGGRLTLHGTISIQRTLPFGTTTDVREEALDRIRACGENGGLILAPSHAPQPEVPTENILTLYETVRRTPLGAE